MMLMKKVAQRKSHSQRPEEKELAIESHLEMSISSSHGDTALEEEQPAPPPHAALARCLLLCLYLCFDL